jgi:hypothetical protein
MQALGAKLGVSLDGNRSCLFPAEWKPIQLLQRCGPQLSSTASESLANDTTRAPHSGTQTGATIPPANGLAPVRISANATTQNVSDGAATLGSSADHSKRIQGRSCRSGVPVNDLNSVPLDPVWLHCQSSFPCTGPVLLPAPLAGPGASVGQEWRMVRMVRERVPVDLLPRVPLEAEHEVVCPILDRLLDLVVSRLQVHR